MGGRAAVWLVLLVEDCCYVYSLQVAVLPPSLPLQPMRGPWWRVVLCVLKIRQWSVQASVPPAQL
jgi:hypothetical protein